MEKLSGALVGYDDDDCTTAIRRDAAAVSMRLVPIDDTRPRRRNNTEGLLRSCLEAVYFDIYKPENMRELLSLDTENKKATISATIAKYKKLFPEVILEDDADKLIFSVVISAVRHAMDDVSQYFLNEEEHSVRNKILQQVRASESFVDNSEELQTILGYLPPDFLVLAIIACSVYTTITLEEANFLFTVCCDLVNQDNKEYLQSLDMLSTLQRLEKVFFQSLIDIYFDSEDLCLQKMGNRKRLGVSCNSLLSLNQLNSTMSSMHSSFSCLGELTEEVDLFTELLTAKTDTRSDGLSATDVSGAAFATPAISRSLIPSLSIQKSNCISPTIEMMSHFSNFSFDSADSADSQDIKRYRTCSFLHANPNDFESLSSMSSPRSGVASPLLVQHGANLSLRPASTKISDSQFSAFSSPRLLTRIRSASSEK